jgi:uncharacterized protein YbaP (TraB family)
VKICIRAAFAFFAVSTMAAAAAYPAAADPAIWHITGPRAEVFIVGSTPAVPVDGKWKTPALQHAAAGAQEVWFTTPFGLPGPFTALRMLATMQSHGSLPEGQKLSSMLSTDGRARMARLAARYGQNFDKLDRMAPWYAHVTLGLAAKHQDGTSKGLPVERYVIDTAPRSAPKRAMDNLEDDLKLLIATPENEQIADLELAMRHYDDPAINQRYGQAWAAGDQEWIEHEQEDWLRQKTPETYRTMQLDPRKRWAAQIAELAQGSKTVIVVLDAANLVGQNGLPAILRRKGLQVEGP